MPVLHRIAVLLIITALAACSALPTRKDSSDQAPLATSPMPPEGQRVTTYDSESWKYFIADSCQAYFDGCNHCRRALDAKAVACTRKACIKYQKPYCLDIDSEPHWRHYQCTDGRKLAVYFGEYRTAALAVTLPANKLLLEDHLSNTSYTLERAVSASGSLYRDEGVSFWAKGTDAQYTPEGSPALSCEQSARGSFDTP